MQNENQLEKYAEQNNVVIRLDPNISPIKNALFVSKSFANSMTIYKTHEFIAKTQKTKLGLEEFTKDIPNANEWQTRFLDENGIVSLDAFVSSGDIIIGEVRPKGDTDLMTEERLLQAIFGDKAHVVKDISIRVPENVTGVVTKVKIETRKENPKMEKGVDKIVSVSICQTLPLLIGDVLEDNSGNKGIVVGYIDNKDHCSIIANFSFNGVKVTRNSSILELQRARSTGNYNLLGKPCVQGLFNDPQKLSFFNLIKTIKSGHLMDLMYLVIGSADYKVRSEIYDRIIREVDLPVYYINSQFLLRILFILNGIGVKCIIRYDGKTVDNPKDILQLGIDRIVNAEDLEVTFAPLTDADIIDYSYGEVSSSDSFDWSNDLPTQKGIYSQSIFGPIKDWECACGKYKRIRFKGVKCEECGVEVASSFVRTQRMGYLSFPIKLENCVYSNIKNANAVVIPPELRPLVKVGYKRYLSSDLHELYNRVISRNNRLKRLNELEAKSIIIENEQKLLTETYKALLFGQNGKLGYIDYLFNNLYNSIENVTLDFSAITRAIIGKNISQNHIGIPINIALLLYSPYIMRELVKCGKSQNVKTANKIITNRAFDDNDKDSFDEYIVNLFNKSIMPYVLLMSDSENGEALHLAPIISDKPVFELNEQDYARLSIDDPLELVKAFLPPTNNAVKTDKRLIDKQVGEIKIFAENLKQYAALSKDERDKNIITFVRNTQKLNVNSFTFCYLTGRGFSASDRRAALLQLENDTPTSNEKKETTQKNNKDSDWLFDDLELDDLFSNSENDND